MKNLLYTFAAAALLAGASGCCGDFWNHHWCWERNHDCDTCHSCGQAPSGPPVTGPAGPPTGAVAYPYYSNRGPRDFFDAEPDPDRPLSRAAVGNVQI